MKSVIEAAEALGANRQALLADVGLQPEWLRYDDNRLPVAQYYQLYETAAAITQTPDLGLLAGRISFLTEASIQQYLSTFCCSFREYLNRVPSIQRTSGDIGRINISKDQHCIRLEWHPENTDGLSARLLTDDMLSSSAMVVNALCVWPIPVIKAELAYAQPRDLTQLRLAFGKEIAFGHEVSCLYYPKAALDYPLIHAGEGLGEEILAAMQTYFEEDAPHDPLLRELRACIARRLPEGRIAVEPVANELAISARSLQRRLEKRTITFQQLVRDVRIEMAKRYLNDKRVGITEVAFLLGYVEPASFTKAFRGWCGMSPSEYRQGSEAHSDK